MTLTSNQQRLLRFAQDYASGGNWTHLGEDARPDVLILADLGLVEVNEDQTEYRIGLAVPLGGSANHPINHTATDASSGTTVKFEITTDQHGLVVTPEGREPIIIDVSNGEVRIGLGTDDVKIIGLSEVLVGCPYCNPNGPNEFEDEYACRQGGGPCGGD